MCCTLGHLMAQSDVLTKAVSAGNAWSVSQELALDGDQEALALSNLCARIFEETEAEGHRLSRLAADLDAIVVPDRSGQLHLLEVAAAGREDAQRFISRIQRDGYVGWADFEGAAAESFFRHEQQATLVRLEGTAFTVVITWGKSRRAARLPGPLRPNAADHSFLSLPSKLWPAYVAIRPVRLVSERVRRKRPDRSTLGPILSTPESLLDELLDFAEVEASDHLVDLGCGEGRVVMAAAQRRGCSATGVEKDPRLVDLFERRLAAAPELSSQVSVVEADARDFSLANATVVFLFMPAESVAETVYQIRAGGFEGRIVSHEQRYIAGGIRPATSRVLIGTDALTVAHIWP